MSVDLVSLEKMLSLQNCNDLINSELLARREKAKRARLDAQRAVKKIGGRAREKWPPPDSRWTISKKRWEQPRH